ncbi:MAG: hypothetical protein ACR5K4_03800 [Sodalis sp. (in: enterobacteria)]
MSHHDVGLRARQDSNPGVLVMNITVFGLSKACTLILLYQQYFQ